MTSDNSNGENKQINNKILSVQIFSSFMFDFYPKTTQFNIFFIKTVVVKKVKRKQNNLFNSVYYFQTKVVLINI